MSKPKPLELELERLSGKTPRTSSLWKKTNDDCTLPAGRTLGPCPPPARSEPVAAPGPRPVAGAGACPPGPGPRPQSPRPVAGEGACPPPARQCTCALVVSLVAESWKACGMQQRFGTGSKIENKEEIRRNQLEISSN